MCMSVLLGSMDLMYGTNLLKKLALEFHNQPFFLGASCALQVSVVPGVKMMDVYLKVPILPI